MALHLAALHGSCLRVAVIVEEWMVTGTPLLLTRSSVLCRLRNGWLDMLPRAPFPSTFPEFSYC